MKVLWHFSKGDDFASNLVLECSILKCFCQAERT